MPGFVEQEFRDVLRRGWLAGGFARLRRTRCRRDRLVAFSCKGRGFCPSCGGRRMVERSAHLVDHVLPDVPVRQWVLTLPHRLRYRLAWDHQGCRAVTRLFVRAVFGCLRRRLRERGVAGGRSGAVVVLQRFGGALNLNVHLHALVLDGVFASGGGRLRFHTLPALTTANVADVLATIVPRVLDWLARHGDREEDAADEWLETTPILAGLAAASVQGVAALGPAAGRRVQRFGRIAAASDASPWPPVRRGRTDSICMQRCASARVGASDWNACVDMCCGRPWRRTG